MNNPSNEYFSVAIVEVLILQRFPYGKNSTFFYFAFGDNLCVQEGDVVSVPWRKGKKLGVIVRTKRIIIKSKPKKEWKINLNSFVKTGNYFFSPIPARLINLKPINEIIEKGYFSPGLLLKLRIAAEKYFVSWNHFAKLVVSLSEKSKNPKHSYVSLFHNWVDLYEKMPKNISSKNIALGNSILLSVKQKKVPFIHIPGNQTHFLNLLFYSACFSGKQVLVLVPEKTQVLPLASKYAALAKSFSVPTPILLGKFLPPLYFRQAWQLTRSLVPGIFVGTRSSIFAPFSNLGLIILEEGHDASYKQWDMLPRYDTRDILSLFYPDVPKIYSSGTPRLQDFFNSPFYLKEDKKNISIVSLNTNILERKRDIKIYETNSQEQPPHIFSRGLEYEGKRKKVILVNMGTETKLSSEKLSISGYLKKNIISKLKKGKWVFLLVNHRGMANMIMCKKCGFIPRCRNCGKNLSIHLESFLNCRFCGYSEKSFQHCPKCGESDFVFSGFGIDKVKKIILGLKKEVDFSIIASSDKKLATSDLLFLWEKAFFNQKKPVLLLGYAGFLPLARVFSDKIGVAGMLSFDELLFYSDFRSEERAASRFFNLMSVSAKIIVQTENPAHPFLQKIMHNPYSSFFSSWIAERKKFHYPPFTQLIKIEITERTEKETREKARLIAEELRGKEDVLEALPVPGKNRNWKNKVCWNVIIKLKKRLAINSSLIKIMQKYEKIKIDVEPEESI